MLKDLETREIAAEHGYADVVAQKASRMKIDSLLQAFFVEVKHIEKKLIRSDDWSAVQPDFYLLKHRLELVKKRQYVPVEFDQVVLAAMSRIERGGPTDYKDNFLKFAQFLNAFVAYFTFYWGDRTGN
jgi:CRISPR type III-A-associated protein Csm2